MRIGLAAADFWPNVGGVAAHVVELGKALVAQGHEVHVLTRPIGDDRAARAELFGMQVHRPSLVQLRPLSHWSLRHWMRSFMRRSPLDVLHVHGLRPLPATRGLRVPVVFTNHTSGFLQRLERGAAARRRVAAWMQHVGCILAPSEELAEATLSVGVPCPVRYIPNGVDVGRFSPGRSAVRESLGIREEEIVALLARRLVEKNGVCVFAEAVARFVRPGVRVVFAGDGDERGKVEQILARSGCRESAVFLGNVPNTQMPDVYRAADISALPSFLEATSITGLESMATGLPLVGTRVGGIPALIAHEETGLLVEPGDPVELAGAIRRLIANQGLRRSLGAAARERAAAEFSWTAIAARTVDCYERVVRMSRGTSRFAGQRAPLAACQPVPRRVALAACQPVPCAPAGPFSARAPNDTNVGRSTGTGGQAARGTPAARGAVPGHDTQKRAA